MTRDTVALIKDRLSIVEVVNPYVKLKRAGRSMVGLCPFHKEKTPSFYVSPERGTWHCFGCGLGGDIFSFIEKIEGVDFKGALNILAEKAGVIIEYTHDENYKDISSKKERLFTLMNQASEWYVGELPGSPAETYAKKRGLTDETIVTWRIGYAPDAWHTLLKALTARGFTTDELVVAGLIKEADGKPGTYYDRFRNRLLFPIRNSSGRTVAFTGRTLAVDEQAKYLNSPETDLYHKFEILFGMDMAKDAIRMRDFTMLVEGQMDVLLAHQAGFKNTVALSGTALSEHHISLMKRYSENLMLVLDADSAGLMATARSAKLALRQGLRVKAASLPSGEDPADLINKDPKEFSTRVIAAKPIVDFFLAELAELERDQHRFQRLVQEIVYPLLASISNLTERGYFIEKTARYLQEVPIKDIHESVKQLSKYSEIAGDTVSIQKSAPLPVRSPTEVRSEQLIAVFHSYHDTPLAKRVESEYCRITGAQNLPFVMPPESALFYAEQTFGKDPDEHSADELLHAFEEAVIRKAYQEAVGNLRRAEISGDAVLIANAQSLCAKLSTRLAMLGN